MAPHKYNITVLHATEEDAVALTEIEGLAFDTSPTTDTDSPAALSLGRIMFGPPSAERTAVHARELVERMKSNTDGQVYKAVITDETTQEEKIVGYSSWKFFTTPFPVEDTWKDKPWESALNPAACNEFFGTAARLRTKHMGGKKCALLGVLAIHPDYQGKGVGSKMLQRGLDDAAALGLDEAFLEATPAGHPLYIKFGWRDVETFGIDLSKYGGVGVRENTFMRRV